MQSASGFVVTRLLVLAVCFALLIMVGDDLGRISGPGVPIYVLLVSITVLFLVSLIIQGVSFLFPKVAHYSSDLVTRLRLNAEFSRPFLTIWTTSSLLVFFFGGHVADEPLFGLTNISILISCSVLLFFFWLALFHTVQKFLPNQNNQLDTKTEKIK